MNKIISLFCIVLLFAATNLFAQEKEPIRVGVFLDITGPTSSFGESTFNGIKMAVDEINASGGIDGRIFEIFLEDNQVRPEQTKIDVKRLISVDKVHVLIGDVPSTSSLAAAPVAQEAKIPMISPASTNPKVTQVGDYIFRACFVDPFQGEAMAKFAFNDLKIRRVAILEDAWSDYSKGLTETFTKTFTKFGGNIISKQSYEQLNQNYLNPDFKEQLRKIRRLKPDAIYLPGYYGQVAIIAKQARELKMNMPLLGGDGWDSPELWKLGGNALKNSYITNHFAVDNPAVEVQKFIEAYQTKFNLNPDSLAVLGYDTIYILADALRRAKTTDGQKLRDALAQTKDFYGVTGKINFFDASRNPIKPAVILKLEPQNSKFIYHSTIQPEH